MSRRPWYKRYGGDFVLGTMALSLEEKGAYSLCLDLIYDRGGPIPDDARWLAGMCGVSIRKWNALRDRLIETGKLVAGEGCLTNGRAEREIAEAAEASREFAENGAKGGRKRAENAAKLKDNSDENEAVQTKNNDLGQARLKPNQIPEPDNTPSSPPRGTISPKVTKGQVEAVWSACPQKARERSSRADVEQALGGALRRGHSPDAVLPGLLAAYRSDTYAGDRAKGIHRLIEKDRWASFVEASPAPPVASTTFDGPPALRDSVAREHGEDFVRRWLDHYCRWRSEDRTIIARTPLVAATLEKDLAAWLARTGVQVEVEAANDQSEQSRRGAA